MGWILLGIAIAVIVWGIQFARQLERARLKPETEAQAEQAVAAIPRDSVRSDQQAKLPRGVKLAQFESVADLRDLAFTRYRIKGSANYLSDANREFYGGAEYHLFHELNNSHDDNAVAVFGKGLKVGYISAVKAAVVAPLLDQLPEEAFLVGGAGTTAESIRLWIDLPTAPALRSYVKSRVGGLT